MQRPHEVYGWPPRMIMRVACAYTGRSRWVLGQAVRSGCLKTAGRNGRSLVFDRSALDAWLVGEPSTPVAKPDPSATAPRRAHPVEPSGEAMTRLRLVSRGEAGGDGR